MPSSLDPCSLLGEELKGVAASRSVHLGDYGREAADPRSGEGGRGTATSRSMLGRGRERRRFCGFGLK